MKARAAVPLIVLVVTTGAVVVAKIRSELRAKKAPTPSSAAVLLSDASAPSREPSLGAPPALGDGRVVDSGVRMLHGDPARTHRARGRVPKSPRERWRTKLGGHVVTQAVLSADEKTIYAGSYEGSLVALDRTGAVKWKTPLGERIYSTPFVGDDGTIYVGSDAKRFYAVGPDGAIRWKLDVDGEADTSPAPLSQGRITFAAGPTLYVLSTRGDVRARFRAKKKIYTSPAVGADDTIYFGSHDRSAYAVKADGAMKWNVTLGADVDGGPALDDRGNVVFGTDGGRIVKLRTDDGSTVWSTEAGGYVRGALSIARDGAVLAGVYGPTPGMFRIDEAGRIAGVLRIGGPGSRDFGVHGGPLEDEEGTLVFGTEDDHVYGIERDGKQRFRLDRSTDVDAPITLTRDGALIVGGDDGTVAELGD